MKKKYITYNGLTLTVTGWAARLGVSRQRISQRLNKYPVDEALSLVRHDQVRHGHWRDARRYSISGESLTIAQLAKKYGLKKSMIYCRLKRGVSIEAVIRPPHAINLLTKGKRASEILNIICRHCGKTIRDCVNQNN